MVQVYNGYTWNGTQVSCSIDPDEGEAVVEYQGDHYLLFRFNPDFPDDAKTFFVALCNVKEVIVDDEE